MKRDFSEAMTTEQGITAMFENIHYLRAAAYEGDIDALVMLSDIETAMEATKISDRQRQAFELVMLVGMTRQEAANVMEISQQAVSRLIRTLAKNVAAYFRNASEVIPS